MIDWNLVAKIAGGGYGICILVLVILSLVAWIVGLVVQKTTKTPTENKVSAKGK
jgi:Na+-transporting methylmalonyl-CoA/oxaloacetate decarboxylase gamma subunit